jgi:hypothetical protein
MSRDITAKTPVHDRRALFASYFDRQAALKKTAELFSPRKCLGMSTQ